MPNPSPNQWFADQVEPHEHLLRGYLKRAFPSISDVDDVVQESYLKLIRSRERGKIAYAKAYLFTTARNIAFDLFRRRRTVQFESLEDDSLSGALSGNDHPSDSIDKQEELTQLADAVSQLPERCRQVMTLRLLYGLSHLQIAAELQISPHTVKAQIAKGLRRCAVRFEAVKTEIR